MMAEREDDKVQKTSMHLKDLRVPAPLQDDRRWLMYRLTQAPGEKKPKKMPFYVDRSPRTGKHNDPDDVGKLATFQEARNAAARFGFSGVGYALTKDTKVIALDVDNCIDADGKIHPTVYTLINNTYAEISPSGKGVRAFYKNDADIHFPDAKHHEHFGDDTFGIEFFVSNGFVTVTGNALDHVDLCGLQDHVASLPAAVVEYAKKRMPHKYNDAPFNAEDAFRKTAQGLSYEDLMRVGLSLYKNCTSLEEQAHAVSRWVGWAKDSSAYTNADDFSSEWRAFGKEKLFAEPLGLKPEQVEHALGVFPNDLPYEASVGPSWLSIGMAIHHESKGAAWGFKLWDNWSKLSPKYSSESYSRSKWSSFNRSDAITARSLLRWANEHGADIASVSDVDEFDDLSDEPSDEKQPKAERFKIEQADAFAVVQQNAWLIKNVIPNEPLGIMFGPSGCAKSFLMLSMMMALATGTPWRGNKTKQKRVLIIAAEGAASFRKRVRAYAIYHGVDLATAQLWCMGDTPNFVANLDHVKIAQKIKEMGGIDVIVIDTLSQTAAGADENNGKDMSMYLSRVQKLGKETGAMVLLVHHSGKDETRGARGWSGLKCNINFEMSVERDAATNVRRMRTSKMKEGADNEEFYFNLQIVGTTGELGYDDDGDAITSCVCVDAESSEWSGNPGGQSEGRCKNMKLSEQQRQAIDHIDNFFGLSNNEGTIHIDSIITLILGEASDTDARKSLRRAIRSIFDRGLVHGRFIDKLGNIHAEF